MAEFEKYLWAVNYNYFTLKASFIPLIKLFNQLLFAVSISVVESVIMQNI
jgi:hypothetical protein